MHKIYTTKKINKRRLSENQSLLSRVKTSDGSDEKRLRHYTLCDTNRDYMTNRVYIQEYEETLMVIRAGAKVQTCNILQFTVDKD